MVSPSRRCTRRQARSAPRRNALTAPRRAGPGFALPWRRNRAARSALVVALRFAALSGGFCPRRMRGLAGFSRALKPPRRASARSGTCRPRPAIHGQPFFS